MHARMTRYEGAAPETIEDTAAVLSRYVHAIVIRTFGQERLHQLAPLRAITLLQTWLSRCSRAVPAR